MGEEEEEGRWMKEEKWLWRPLPHLFPSEGESGMLPPSPLRLEGVEKSEGFAAGGGGTHAEIDPIGGKERDEGEYI